MGRQSSLAAAKKAGNGDFATDKRVVEEGLRYYAPYFKGACVLCNCGDTEESEFVRLFLRVFKAWGIARLIATSYSADGGAYYIDVSRRDVDEACESSTDDIGADAAALCKPRHIPLGGDGDFRSPACMRLMRSADIVATAPPPPLLDEYIGLVADAGVPFIALGNINAVSYGSVFPLIRDDKIWVSRCGRYADSRVRWLTNIDTDRRHEPLDLRGYEYAGSGDRYPTYDNYCAIDVGRTKEIPGDYFGVMGVPLSFLDKYCPEQFEILGLGSGRLFTPSKLYANPVMRKDGTESGAPFLNYSLAYKAKGTESVTYTADNADYPLVSPYARLLIRRRDTG